MERYPSERVNTARPDEPPVEAAELANALRVMHKIQASLQQPPERAASRQSRSNHNYSYSGTAGNAPPYSVAVGSVRPDSPIDSFPLPRAPPQHDQFAFNPPEDLPPRVRRRQSAWRQTMHALDPANRRTSGMLFGPGGPATQGDPELPIDSNELGPKHKDPIVSREYLYRLSKALLHYGAPGHRLERYLHMTAKALQSEVDFVYLPDSLTLYFDDPKNHTGHTRLIKGGGTDLGRWLDIHNVSKHVMAGNMTIEDGIEEINTISNKKPLHSDWFLLLIYGFAGIGIAPFAYGARFVDLPICFVFSSILGFMQLKLAPRNHLYSVLFEVSAAVLFSFLGRLVGSIKNIEGDRVFCYGAISEASINLIQPGYWITNACLELMNRQIGTSGARLVYALVYAMLLAYGVAVGSSLYGLIDHDAVASTVCENQISPFFNLFFVPFFSIQVALLGGAKWRQLPAMVSICFVMYSAFFFSSMLARGSFIVGATAGGITMGVLGNGYARVGRVVEHFFERKATKNTAPDPEYSAGKTKSWTSHIGFTCGAAAMVPSMIVLVPSGLANRASHLAGILAAESIVRNTTGVPAFPAVNAEVFTAAFPIYVNVFQVSLSIAVGISLGALIIYPFGKSRSWVMSW